MASSEQNVPLPDSERAHARGVRRIGPAPPDRVLAVSFVLRRKPGAPDLPDAEHWQRTPVRRRRYLPRSGHDEPYGADAADIEKVAEFARRHGMTIARSDVARRRVDVSGTVAQFDAAFGISLGLYESPRETYHGHEGALHVPRALAPIIAAVFGLDGRRMAERLSGGGVVLHGLEPPEVAALYGFPTPPSTMAGQTVGIFEFGGGYTVDASGNATDVDTFLAALHPPLPKVKVVAPTVPQTLPDPPVHNAPGTAAHPNQADPEVVLDISVVAAVAVGATIAVYFSNFTENGWLNAIDTVLFPSATEPAPSVVSISYGVDEAFWSAGQLKTLSDKFKHLNAKGVTVFTGSGDDGSMGNAPEPDGRAHVCYPSVDPWITTCGGTKITNISGSSFDELTWTTPGALRGITGGGISTATDSLGHLVFPLQSWQSGANVPPSINDGKTRGRGLPDIAGHANGYGLVLYGSAVGFGGTSAVCPLYAALVAILNARLGANVGYLNPTIYELAETVGFDIFRDIDDNASNAASFTLPPPNPPTIITSPGYHAIKGWDACTGWGSLKATRFFGALAHLPLVATAIANSGSFGNACVESFVDEMLTINNSGFGLLAITAITSSSADFLAPGVSAFPLLVSVGSSIDVTIRFRPISAGAKAGKISIISNDPSSPHIVDVSGDAVTPRLDLAIADSGKFANACAGFFADEPIVLNNSGKCPLSVSKIASSSPSFLVPAALSYPLVIAPGASTSLPIRFAPATAGSHNGTITVDSNDPAGARHVDVSGEAPSGTLTIGGSAWFGAVRCRTEAQRTIWVCNTGNCFINVIEAAFKYPLRAFRLVNDPFPATLRPGACLPVVIAYRAEEREPIPCALLIKSDDPVHPVLCVDVVASTDWTCCGEKDCCGGCGEKPQSCCCGEKRRACCSEGERHRD